MQEITWDGVSRKEKPAQPLHTCIANLAVSPQWSLCYGTAELAVQSKWDLGQTEKLGHSKQLFGGNKKVLIMAYRGPAWPHLLTSLPYSLCSSLRRILPQWLCTCYVFCLVYSFPSYLHSLAPHLLQATVTWLWTSSDHPVLNSTPLQSHSALFFSL